MKRTRLYFVVIFVILTLISSRAYSSVPVSYTGIPGVSSGPYAFPCVFPEDFGAKGDGVTDDSTAISSALASASALGKNLCLTRSYKTASFPSIPNGIALVGSGRFTNYPWVLTQERATRPVTWPNLQWNTDDSVSLGFINQYSTAHVFLNGLYGQGSHKDNEGNALWVELATSTVHSFSTETTGTLQSRSWYAVFVALNASGNVVLKSTPFIRVNDDAGNVLTIASQTNYTASVSYGIATNSLAGCDILVLANEIPVLTNVGELRSIVSNTERSLTYNSTSLGLSSGSWVMLSPPGVSRYRYIGCVLIDEAFGLLNFVKDQNEYVSYGYNILENGSSSVPVYLNGSGYLPPTGSAFRLNAGLVSKSSVATGTGYAGYLYSDNSRHYIQDLYGITTNYSSPHSTYADVWVTPRYPLAIVYSISTYTSGLTLQLRGYRE